MKTAAQIGGVVMAGMLMAGAAAAAPPPGFEATAQTSRFKFFTRGHDSAVDAQKVEKFMVSLEHTLGQQYSGQAQYYRYDRPEDIAAATGSYVSGVTFAGTREIHTTQAFHAHEIVHLVAAQMGNPGVFFQEGLAVALGNEAKWQGKDVDALARKVAKSTTISSFVARFDSVDADTAYSVAGSFVKSLIKTYGIAKVATFFRACGPKATNPSVAFASTFGQSLDEAGAAWSATL